METTGFLNKVKLSTKVFFVGLFITGLLMAATLLWILPKAERTMVAARKRNIQEQTETVWSILTYFDGLVKQHGMPLEDARKSAADLIRNVRYGPTMKAYFWINDTQPKMIMHPYRPELNGRDLSDLRDPNGIAPYAECVRVAKEHGEGFVSYSWQWNDDQSRILPKISYVRLFRPWGWIVGTGMYIENVKAEIKSWRTAIFTVYVSLAAICVILLGIVGKEIGKRSPGVAVPEGSPAYTAEADSETRHETALRMDTFVLVVAIPALLILVLGWSVLFYTNLHRIILNGFDRKLFNISSVTGAFIKGEDHAAIAAAGTEDSSLYRHYVRPMHNIMQKADITYLYSQTLSEDGSHFRYVLDATEGEEHSQIGYTEDLSADDYQVARSVLLHGIVHISDVEPTDNWGLLKFSYAPIFDSDGSIDAMAGADVNIGVIKDKTRVALFAVCLIGVAALLVAGYFSIVISRKLTEPLNIISEGALRIARGSYDYQVDVTSPVEFKELAETVNTIGSTLNVTLNELVKGNEMMESRKRLYDLTLALDKDDVDTSSYALPTCAFGRLNNKASRKTPSGWITGIDCVLFWLARPVKEPLNAVKLRSDIVTTCGRLLAQTQGDPAWLKNQLQPLFVREVSCFCVYSVHEARIHCILREPLLAVVLENGRYSETIFADKDRVISIEPNHGFLISEDETFLEEDFINSMAEQHERGMASPAHLMAALQEQEGILENDLQVMVGVIYA